MQYKNLTISTAKSLAILLVVYGHVIQRSMLPMGQDFFLNPVFKIIYTFHMPLFFFISGYLMSVSLERRNLVEAFQSRCKGLLIPFVSWGILGILSFYFFDKLSGKSVNLLMFPVDAFNQLLLNPLIWFLFTLFAVSGLLLCSVYLEKRLGAAAFAVIFGLLMMIPYHHYCALYYIKWFYLFYLVGFFVHKQKIQIHNPLISRIVFIVSFFIFMILAAFWSKDDYIYINKMDFLGSDYFSSVLRVIYRYVVGFLGIYITFMISKWISRTKFEKSLSIIGLYSLDIYLIQRYIVEGIYPIFVEKFQLKLDFNSPFFLGIFAPIATVLFVLLCLWVSHAFIRRNSFLNKILFGR